MVGWDYTEKMMRDFVFNHAKDFGKFYCQMLIDSPKVYKEFMEGFYDEYQKRYSDDYESERSGRGADKSGSRSNR